MNGCEVDVRCDKVDIECRVAEGKKGLAAVTRQEWSVEKSWLKRREQ